MTSPQPPAPAGSLAAALAQLVTAGVAGGLDAGSVRAEGGRLAAAVAESSPGAPAAWLTETGNKGTTTFFTAAASARRWRVGPTDLLQVLRTAGSAESAEAYADALTTVAAAAATLGQGGPQAAAAAVEVAAAQRGISAQVAPGSGAPRTVGSVPVVDLAPGLTDLVTPASGRPATGYPTPELTSLGSLPDVGSILQALQGLAPAGAGGQVAPSVPGQPAAPGAAPAVAAGAEGAVQAAAEQAATDSEAAQAEAEPEPTVEELFAKLDDLVGLDRAKREVRRQVELLRVERLRAEAGLTKPTLTRHLVFIGNPGTGKTTVARLVSQLYKAIGLLTKGHLVEVDRSELVAGYLGQTAQKTSEVVASAVGGVLFIDEAYALTQSTTGSGPDSYGQEAVNTLVKDMEDHRADLVVIVAGYPGPMAEFIGANPGLESRFSTTIQFEDYTDPELRDIFALMAKGADFEPTPEALDRVAEITAAQPRHAGFGNARFVRNLLDDAIAHHAWRLKDIETPTIDELRLLLPEDLADPGPGTAARHAQAQAAQLGARFGDARAVLDALAAEPPDPGLLATDLLENLDAERDEPENVDAENHEPPPHDDAPTEEGTA